MDIEKLHLRFVLRPGVWLLVICCLSVAACSPPSYTKPFVFEQGLKRLEIIEVDHPCTYEVGILFFSRAEDRTGDRAIGDEAIRKFFGTPRNINMPATVDIYLLDEHGRHFLSIADFGGAVPRWYYGPNPLRLIAGWVSLDPGKYIAMINIKDIDGDFSGFRTEFFVSEHPKGTCGREKSSAILIFIGKMFGA